MTGEKPFYYSVIYFQKSMKKIALPLLIVFAVSAAAAYVYLKDTKIVVPEVVERMIVEENEAQRYTINIKYPEITALSSKKALTDVNVKLRELIDFQIADFKVQVAETAEFILPQDMSSGLWISYSVPTLTNEFISIAMPTSNYSAGAAHPNNYTVVFNYDVKERKVVELGDLFGRGSSYLEVIAAFSEVEVTRQLQEYGFADEAGIAFGTYPKSENYRNFVIKNRQLVILFDPYQVAPYAAGGQEVVIPSELITDIIAPNGPLSEDRPPLFSN